MFQRIVTFSKRFSKGLVGVLEAIEKKPDVKSAWIQKLVVLCNLMQMLSFVTMDAPGTTWPQSLSPIETVAGLTSTRGYNRWTTSRVNPSTVVWLAFAWVTILILLLAYGIWCSSINYYPVMLPLRALRIMGQLSGTILFIPLLQMLLKSPCTQGSDCNLNSMSGLVQLSVSILFSCFLIALALLFACVYFDSSMVSKDLSAASHGRTKALLLAIQVILVICTNTFQLSDLGLRLAILSVSGCIWLASNVYFLPYHAHEMNRYYIAGGTVYITACFCLAINIYNNAADAGLMLWIGCPLAVGCGFAIADCRANSILCTPIERLSNPFEVDIKARLILNRALLGHPYLRFSNGADLDTRIRRQHTSQAVSGVVSSDAPSDSSKNGSSAPFDGVGGLQSQLSREAVISILDLYRGSLTRFTGNAMFHLFCSRMYSELLGNKHMQMSHLHSASRSSPPFDVRFMVQREKNVLEDSGKSHGSIGVFNRIVFDKSCSEVRRNVMRASSRQLAFFTELAEATPDLSRLHTLCKEINSSVRGAELNFEEIFKISPQALTQMRLFAAFNINVTGNSDKASVLLAEAERIEDHRSKEHRLESGNHVDILSTTTLDMWSDSVAQISVSSQPRELGVIVGINVAACRLFNQTRVQLERRSAFSLIPPVLDRLLENSLRQYALQGEATYGMVDYTRVILVSNKSGALVPVISSFKDSSVEDSSTFLWSMREFRTDTEFVLLDASGSPGNSFGAGTILALTAGAALFFHLETSPKSSAVYPPITEVLPEIISPANQEALLAGHSLTLTVKPLEDALPSSGENSDNDSDSGDSLRGEGSVDEEVNRSTSKISPPRSPYMGTGTRRSEVPGVMPNETLPPPPNDAPPSSLSPTVTAVSKLASIGGQNLNDPFSAGKRKDGTLPTARTIQMRPNFNGTLGLASTPSLNVKVRLQRFREGDSNLDILHISRIVHTQSPKKIMSPSSAIPSKTPGSATFSTSTRRTISGGLTKPPGDSVTAAVRAASPDPPNDINKVRGASDTGVISASLTGLTNNEQTQPSPALTSEPPTNSNASTLSAPIAPEAPPLKSPPGNSFSGRSSVGSSESRLSSLTSVMRAMARFRRIVLNENPSLMSGFVYLRLAGLFLLALCIALASVNSVESQKEFTELAHQVDYSDLSLSRIFYKSESILSLQSMIFHYQNYLPSRLTQEALNRAKEYVLGNLTKFSTVHLELFSLAQYLGLSDEWITNYITLYRFDVPWQGSTPLGNTEVVNQATLGARFATLMKLLAKDDGTILAANKTADSPFNAWNSGGSLLASLGTDFQRKGNGHEVFAATIISGFEDVKASVARLRAVQLIIYLAMMLSSAVVGLAVFIPILRFIDKTSDSIMLQFVNIPHQIRKLLLVMYAQRLRTLRKQFSGEEGEEELSDEEDEPAGVESSGLSLTGSTSETMERFKELLLSGGVSTVGGARDTELTRETELWATLFKEGGLQGLPGPTQAGGNQVPGAPPGKFLGLARSRRRKVATYKKSVWGFVSLMGRFTSPLLLLFILFSVIFGSFFVASESALQLSAASVAAGERTSCAVQFLVGLNKYLMASVDPTSRKLLFFYNLKTLDCIKDHNTLLSYGRESSGLTSDYAYHSKSPEDGLSSPLSSENTKSLYKAAFGDTCAFLEEHVVNFDAARCRSFSGGVLTLGLSSLIDKFYYKGYALLDTQLRTSFHTSGNTSGWTQKETTFDYSSYKCVETEGCVPSYSLEFSHKPIAPSYLPKTSTPWTTPYGMHIPSNYTPTMVLSSDDYAYISDALKLYLIPASLLMQSVYVDSTMDILNGFLNLISMFIPTAVAIISLYIFMWWLPSASAESKLVLSKRAMLLYLPPPVILNIPSLRSMIQSIVAREGDEALGKGKVGAKVSPL